MKRRGNMQKILIAAIFVVCGLFGGPPAHAGLYDSYKQSYQAQRWDITLNALIDQLSGDIAALQAGAVHVTSIASSATPTPAVAYAVQEYDITALAVDATFGAPTGTPVVGQRLLIWVYSAGTHALAWNSAYHGATTYPGALPSTTVAGYGEYYSFIYGPNSKWNYIGLGGDY
jgi:hypothetical protein